MSKLLKGVMSFAIALGFTTSAGAHDPPGVIFEMWQWPSSHLPVLDADLSEWEVVPEELWITEQDLNNLLITQIDVTDTEPDASDLAVRFTFGWNDETERIYLAYDRYDDYWSHQRDDIELAVDADHSGGLYWSSEGQSDEEAQRQRNRHAQISHFFFHSKTEEVGVPWNWHWMTQADWYRGEPYSDGAYQWTEPELGQEYNWQIELWHVWWDDFNWQDPEGSIIHDLQEGEIIGLAARHKDGDVGLCCGNEETGEVFSDWALNFNESSENADFLPDWILLPVNEELLATAVENDTWGHIKASFSR